MTQAHRLFLYGKAVFSSIAIFGVFILSALTVLVLVPLSLGTLQNFLVQHLGGFIGSTGLRLSGVRLRIDKREAIPQQVIYIINHSSTLDMFIILSLRLPRTRFVAKYEFLYNPIFFILGRLTGQIFVKRQDTQHAVQALQKTYDLVRRKGLSLLVAPEGTRKHEGKIGPFKKGAFRLAKDLQFPIVPIHVHGARELCPGGSLLVQSGTVHVTFHQTIDPTGWTLEELDDQIAAIREQYIQWEHEKAA